MKITKKGKTIEAQQAKYKIQGPKKAEITCEACETELEIKPKDLRINTFYGNVFVICPCCRKAILLPIEEMPEAFQRYKIPFWRRG